MSTSTACSSSSARTTPVLAGIRPIGERTIEEFEAAGGARALMKQLGSRLDTGALTVTGRTLGDNLRRRASWPTPR